MASGEIEIIPGRVLTASELIDNEKLNDLILQLILRIKQGAITAREIADGSISADKLAVDLEAQLGVPDGSVTTNKIVDDAVTAAKVADDLITAQTAKTTPGSGDLYLLWDVTSGSFKKVTHANLAASLGLPTILTGTATIDPPSMAPDDNFAFTVTVTGAVTTNNPAVALGFSIDYPDGFIIEQARVSASNTVAASIRNASGATVNIASHTVRAVVFQY